MYNYLKRAFIGEYVLNEYEEMSPDIEKSCYEAIGYLAYLFKEEKIFVGTNAEVDSYIKKHYSEQNKDILDKPVDEWWYNGEVCIVRIVNNQLKFPTQYEN